MKKYRELNTESGVFLDSLYQRQAILQDGSVEQSNLPTKLILNYAVAHYHVRVEASSSIILLIGQHCPPLAALLRQRGCRDALYITACNPGSQILSAAKNQLANQRLQERLTQYSRFIYPGESIDLSGVWPAEAGFLALSLELTAAQRIAREFGQNAIVWAAMDAMPKLVLLR
ncbi:DUF3293 domain-containing protein [Nitrosomonas halophila]|uniref:DUF3293 domain-containing protein n=1 Tax=Nitrosomonas halophila TaxID=44576 RepID=UPI001FE155AE|nr:DUF3293 domain-containing protein [Nitrosomonas halophila]